MFVKSSIEKEFSEDIFPFVTSPIDVENFDFPTLFFTLMTGHADGILEPAVDFSRSVSFAINVLNLRIGSWKPNCAR